MVYLCNDQRLKDRRQSLRSNMPVAEQKIWYYLRARNLNNYKFRRQFSIGNYIVDFFCPELKLSIEIDGDSHFSDIEVVNYDKQRTIFLNKQGIKVVRFTNDEVENNIEAVIEKILEYLP